MAAIVTLHMLTCGVASATRPKADYLLPSLEYKLDHVCPDGWKSWDTEAPRILQDDVRQRPVFTQGRETFKEFCSRGSQSTASLSGKHGSANKTAP